MSYDIVRYEERHLGQVVSLQRRMWSRDLDRNARYFHWNYLCNPVLREAHLYLALRGGRVAGMRGFAGSIWEGGDLAAPVPLPLACDAVVAEGHENDGIITMLTEAGGAVLAQAGFPLLLNLHASPVTVMGSLATGWRATRSLEAMNYGPDTAACNPRRERLRRLPLLWRLAHLAWLDTAEERRPFSILDRDGPARLRAISNHLSLQAEAPIDDIVGLVGRIGHDGRLRQRRDPAWLAWKYSNPLTTHRFVCWRDGSGLQGYVMLEKWLSRNANRLEVGIVDCEAAESEVMKVLMQAALAALAGQRVTVWRGALPRPAGALIVGPAFTPHPARHALARQCPCVLVKPLREGPDRLRLGGLDLLDLDSWDLRQVYAD